MNNNTRKIVVLSKLDSPRIEQAIFILRDQVTVTEKDAVGEAQRIVENYLKSLTMESRKKEKRGKSYRFIAGMVAYTFFTALVTIYIVNFI